MSTVKETVADLAHEAAIDSWGSTDYPHREDSEAVAGDILAIIRAHRDGIARAVATADIDWEGRNTSTWDRAASVADAVLDLLDPKES